MIRTTGYPDQVEVSCNYPDGYYVPSQWVDGMWLKGKWKNAEKVTQCFDPLRCYDKPPSLPPDYTVGWNVTDDSPPPDAPVNYTVQYKCDRKCKPFSKTSLLHFDV